MTGGRQEGVNQKEDIVSKDTTARAEGDHRDHSVVRGMSLKTGAWHNPPSLYGMKHRCDFPLAAPVLEAGEGASRLDCFASAKSYRLTESSPFHRQSLDCLRDCSTQLRQD